MASANDPLVAGQQISFTLAYDGPALDPAGVQSTLASWAPFKSLVKLQSVNDAGGAFQIQAMPQPGSGVLTLGGLASGAADFLNQSSAAASGFSRNFRVVGLGSGLGATSLWQQFLQEGGITLSPIAPVTPGAPSWEIQLLSPLFGGGSGGSGSGFGSPNGGFSWLTLGLIALGVFVVVDLVE